MQVVAFPAFWNRTLNPYNALLYEHLGPMVGSVSEYGHRHRMPRDVDIFHVHWPDRVILGGNQMRCAVRAALFLVRLANLKRKGARIVWTAHNLSAHEEVAPVLSKTYWPAFLALLDGVIYLSNESRRQAIEVYPALKSKCSVVIPHGHYRPMVAENGGLPDRATARRALDLPQDKFIFLHFGQIRAYKNVPLLVREFISLDRPDTALVVAGGIAEAGSILEECHVAAAGAPSVHFDFRHVPDEILLQYLAAANVVVLPYRRVLNSGSILLALSANRPTVAPRTGSLVEIANRVGPRWVMTYEGEFRREFLLEACDLHRSESEAPDLSPYDWHAIAASTADFYRELR
jgi:glycosyltransferase involved in cell wall biosynthesis